MSTCTDFMVNSTLAERDLRHIWHPCSQMKDYQDFPPIEIASAEGLYLNTASGERIFDAISSWWSKSLGHRHPRVLHSVQKQLEHYEHVIGANTCQQPLVELSELLCEIVPHLNKVFYSGDGSCAVEIAMKMALQAQQLRDYPERTQFLALKNGYHGETALTLSISDLGLYKSPYAPMLHDYPMLEPIYVNSARDPLWSDCSQDWPQIEQELSSHREHLAAIVFEPIVQGAGGMKVISADFLKRLSQWAQSHGIYVIADEIMTGIGRTGKWLASEHAQIEPDFICLSKGLTSGFCAFSAVMMGDQIYELFYDDYDKKKNFLHSQTYAGNALGAAAGVGTLRTIIDTQLIDHVKAIEGSLWQTMQALADQGLIENIRGIGAVIAADLVTDDKRLGYQVFQKAIKLGAWLRPLGNSLYWIPPLISMPEDIQRLGEITHDAIQAVK